MTHPTMGVTVRAHGCRRAPSITRLLPQVSGEGCTVNKSVFLLVACLGLEASFEGVSVSVAARLLFACRSVSGAHTCLCARTRLGPSTLRIRNMQGIGIGKRY
eukprot:scaffold178770_cov35-Tisochrysis_lutea.AAC.1